MILVVQYKNYIFILEGIYILCDSEIFIIISIILNVAFVAAIVYLSYIISKLKKNKDVTQEEIMELIDVGEETGTIDENEREMINNIFKFDDKTAEDIATHRKEIAALNIDSTNEEIIDFVLEQKYTRIPVYEENIDNIIGILHIKDVLKFLVNNDKSKLNIKKMLMKPMFVPISKKTDELFEQMQRDKIHMCIVIDEYGGTQGIVTMEDLIEEVMGDILDEYDEEEIPDITSINENEFVIDGTTDLETVSEELGIEFPEEDYDTLSGFFIGQIGHIPEDNENAEIEYQGYKFKIEEIEEKRISLIKVYKN